MGADLTGAAELDKSCLESSPLRLEFLHDLQKNSSYISLLSENLTLTSRRYERASLVVSLPPVLGPGPGLQSMLIMRAFSGPTTIRMRQNKA